MKLGMDEIREGIYQAALNRTMRQLRLEGFTVEPECLFERARIRVDLFAHNNNEKRIYEFKFGRNRIQRNQLVRLQEFAKDIGARLYVIYLEMPQSKEISFDGIYLSVSGFEYSSNNSSVTSPSSSIIILLVIKSISEVEREKFKYLQLYMIGGQAGRT